MGLGSWLCGGSETRPREGEDLAGRAMPAMPHQETFVRLKTDEDAAPTAELTSGTLGLNNYGIEVSSEVLEELHTPPWYSLPLLIQSIRQRGRRIRLEFARKERPVSQELDQIPIESDAGISVPPRHQSEIEHEDKDQPPNSSSPAADGINGGDASLSMQAAPSSSLTPIMKEMRANNQRELSKPETAFLAEETSNSAVGSISVSPSSSTGVASTIGINDIGDPPLTKSEPGAATHCLSRSAIEPGGDAHSRSETPEITESSVRRPTVSRRNDSDDWVTFAGMIKTGAGEVKAEKFLYDTGSPNSWVAETLVEQLSLPVYPILPNDLKEYCTIGRRETIIPRFYTEIEVMDEHNGMEEFKKVSFNITETMGGRWLLLGRIFMVDNGITLDPKKGHGVYTFTAREASDAAKEAQRHLLERKERDRVRAKAIAASTTGSTAAATGSSQVVKQAPSSRTSTSSSASKVSPPPKYS